ncbi:GNAT family N-acetyltransferase [Streptomyces sp. BR1]|uniref:GNAT family N-acetyltransferase n=1 Tax=Streptomyces sp. BR1 TaxID=1592323 RepID=UPI00402B74B3
MTAPSVSSLRVAWRNRAEQPPQPALAASPFHSAAWSRAWDRVTTEPVLRRRHLHLDNGPVQHRLALDLVDDSPLWRAATADTGHGAFWDKPVVYAPSLYGLYGGLPGAGPQVLAAAVDHGLGLVAEWDAAALVVGNLTPAEAERWRQARTPDAEVCLYSTSRAPAGASLVDFADRIPSRKIRSEFLRQHRRGADAGLRLTVVTGSELAARAEEFTPDAQQTAQRHGPALYGADIFTGLAGVPGAVALLAEHDEYGFAGGFWCFLHDGVFYLWAAAIHQATKRDLHTYGWRMAEAVLYASAHGAHTIDAGRGNYRYKHRLGFTHTPLTSAVYLTAPDPGLVARLGVLNEDLTRLTHPTPATPVPSHRELAPLRTETL